MQTSTLVIPRALFTQVGFDQQLRCLEDLDLCLRLEEAGARFAMLPEPLVIWYDDQSEGRLSYHPPGRGHRLGGPAVGPPDAARRGRFSGPFPRAEIARKDPMRALGILRAAVQQGGLSAKRAAAIMFRGVAPGTYRRLRDAVVKVRHGKV